MAACADSSLRRRPPIMPSGISAALAYLASWFQFRHVMHMDNLSLRHQLAVYQHRSKRPQLQPFDRLFWVWLSRLWSGFVMPREHLLTYNPGARGARQRWSGVVNVAQPAETPLCHRFDTFSQSCFRQPADDLPGEPGSARMCAWRPDRSQLPPACMTSRGMSSDQTSKANPLFTSP